MLERHRSRFGSHARQMSLDERSLSIKPGEISTSLPDNVLNRIYRNHADISDLFKISLTSKAAQRQCWGWITTLNDQFFDPMPDEISDGVIEETLPFFDNIECIKLVNHGRIAKLLQDSIVNRWAPSIKRLEFSDSILRHFDWGNILAKINPSRLETITMPLEHRHIFKAFVNQTFPALKSAYFIVQDRRSLQTMEPSFPVLENLFLSHTDKAGDFLANSTEDCDSLFTRIKRWVSQSTNLQYIFIKQSWSSALPVSSYPWGDLVRFAADHSDSKIFLSSLRMLLRGKYEDIVTVSQAILNSFRKRNLALPTCVGLETLLECSYPSYSNMQHQNVKRLWGVSRMFETFADLYELKDPGVQQTAQFFVDKVKEALDCFEPYHGYPMIPIIGNLLILIQKGVPGAIQLFPTAARRVDDLPGLLSILLRIRPAIASCLPRIYLDQSLCADSNLDFNALIGSTDPFHISELWLFDPQMLIKFINDPRFDAELRVGGQLYIGVLLHAAALPIHPVPADHMVQQKFWLDLVYDKLLRLHETVQAKYPGCQELSQDLLSYLLNHRLTRMRKYVQFYHDIEMVIEASERLDTNGCKYSLLHLGTEMRKVSHPCDPRLPEDVKSILNNAGRPKEV